jgi:hypothetical protein
LRTLTGGGNLTKGEARAIEEALISKNGMQRYGGKFENRIHSISPQHPYYEAAKAWGEQWLISNGVWP